MSIIVLPVLLLLSEPLTGQAVAPPSPAPSATVSPATGLQPGDRVEPFDAEGIDGIRHRIDFPRGTSTVLVFFTSGCPVCHRMIPEWNRAYPRRPKTVVMIGVLLDKEPPDFFTLTPISFPVVRSPSRALTDAFKVKRVPVTMRIAPGGLVEDVAPGIVDPIRLGEILRP